MTKKILTALFVILVCASVLIFHSMTTPIEVPETANIPQVLTKAISRDVEKEQNAPPAFPANLRGLVLTGNSASLNSSKLEDVAGIVITDLELPGPVSELTDRIYSLYFDKPLSEEDIWGIKDLISQFYEEHNRIAVSFETSEKDLSKGVLRILVTEGRLGKVLFYNNQHFKSELLQKYFKNLEPGQPIDRCLTPLDIAFLNRNPYRQASFSYVPGEIWGTTDVAVNVNDVKPWRIYSGIDNTGDPITGNNRLFAGIDFGNLFGWDHLLSYQFLCTPDVKTSTSHSLNYTIPLPWRHLLSLYGVYSHVDVGFSSGIPGFPFHNTGFSLQGTGRYDILLPTCLDLTHDLAFGYDFKRTNNNVKFDDKPVLTKKNVNLGQFAMIYSIAYDSDTITTNFSAEGYYSPGPWLADQSKSAYNQLRLGSKSRYIYGKSTFNFLWQFCNPLIFNSSFRGQLSSAILLPSEEISIGGMDTVRGYVAMAANGDDGFIMNLEMQTGKIGIGQLFTGREWLDKLKILFFYDYGFTVSRQNIPGQPKALYLASIGPGMRYNISSYLVGRVDWGFQLRRLPQQVGAHQRLHFQLILSY